MVFTPCGRASPGAFRLRLPPYRPNGFPPLFTVFQQPNLSINSVFLHRSIISVYGHSGFFDRILSLLVRLFHSAEWTFSMGIVSIFHRLSQDLALRPARPCMAPCHPSPPLRHTERHTALHKYPLSDTHRHKDIGTQTQGHRDTDTGTQTHRHTVTGVWVQPQSRSRSGRQYRQPIRGSTPMRSNSSSAVTKA